MTARPTLRVLLVEDDDDHVFLIRRAFRGLAGVAVTAEVARTGEQALDHLRRVRFEPGGLPELILLDLKITREPDVSGPGRVCRCLADQQEEPDRHDLPRGCGPLRRDAVPPCRA